MPENASIREARPDDAEAIADVSRRGWLEAYAELLPADFLARRATEPLADAWRAYLRSIPDSHTLLVAEEDGSVVGFIRVGPAAEADPARGGEAEVYGFYVAPERIGRGIGRLLFDAGLDRLREQSYRTVALWTFAGNARAERFYERAGFEPDGTSRPEEESGVEEHRWRRTLNPS